MPSECVWLQRQTRWQMHVKWSDVLWSIFVSGVSNGKQVRSGGASEDVTHISEVHLSQNLNTLRHFNRHTGVHFVFFPVVGHT